MTKPPTETFLIVSAVMRWFPPRRWAVCDCVSWGFDLNHEADAIAVSKSGIVHELEAKSYKGDLARDLKKRKWERPILADYFWYVVPTPLREQALELARPRGFGVIVVADPEPGNVLGCAVQVALPRRDKRVRPQPPERDRRNRIWRLASLRYWDGLSRRCFTK